MTVVMAFDYFRNQKIDVAVVEVGLGGRFDSTNVLAPDLSIITNISLDHQDFLGDTVEKIAFEKAGIIKSNTPIVIGEYEKASFTVFDKVAKEKEALLIKAFENELPENLVGKEDANYLVINKQTAYWAVVEMQRLGYEIGKKELEKAFLNFMSLWQLKGRWQQLGTEPTVFCDTGHNEAGVALLAQRLEDYTKNEIHIIWGMASDKDVTKILKLLPKEAKYYFCQANIPRAMESKKLQEIAQTVGLAGVIEKDVNKALTLAKKSASKEDLIIVGGSTFVVAEIEEL